LIVNFVTKWSYIALTLALFVLLKSIKFDEKGFFLSVLNNILIGLSYTAVSIGSSTVGSFESNLKNILRFYFIKANNTDC
jgi:hypothetical protein